MEKMNFKVVLVEDNPDLQDDLQFQLRSKGIDITAVSDAVEFDEYLSHSTCDIAIIDIGLPGEDGLSITGRMRKLYPHMGIIILTARGELESRLSGFEQGTDIYLIKPVDWRELVAQIDSLYRRMQLISGQISEPNCWTLKQAGRELISPAGVIVELTHNEGEILKILAMRAKEVVSRETIIEKISPKAPHEYDPRRLEVTISRIRQKLVNKLKLKDNNQLPLKTARSKGYMFTASIKLK